jgi:hypothetical protein
VLIILSKELNNLIPFSITILNIVGFSVLTAVAMENYGFWDLAPHSLVKIN